VHVYGAATPELSSWCQARNIPLHLFAWREEVAKAGFARDALYLLRPDTYVALADRSGSADAVQRYFASQQIAL
jgi:hypothetical protein